jgi:Ca2+-transporting ATPase
VNDAPALKEADIGVSMGVSGTDVAKEASGVILLDDNFASLVAAVEEGRIIYRNIRKFIRYMLSCNVGEVLTMFLGMLLGFPVVLLPIQILWINLVTDGLPAIALGLDPPDTDVMAEPPRAADEGIFARGMLRRILTRGAIIGFCTLLVFFLFLRDAGAGLDAARTGAFVTLILTQLIHVFECKSEQLALWRVPVRNNLWLIWAVLSSLALTAVVVYVPWLQGVFRTVPLDLRQVGTVLGVCAAGPVLAGVFHRESYLDKSRRA